MSTVISMISWLVAASENRRNIPRSQGSEWEEKVKNKFRSRELEEFDRTHRSLSPGKLQAGASSRDVVD